MVRPTSTLNFLEGTRATPEKIKSKGGTEGLTNLLPAKTAGIHRVLTNMHGNITEIVDVTLIYHDGVPTFSDFLLCKSGRITIDIRKRPIPAEIINAEHKDRQLTDDWIKPIWAEKDQLITSLITHSTIR